MVTLRIYAFERLGFPLLMLKLLCLIPLENFALIIIKLVTVDTCYKKYEFPPGYKFNTTNRTTQVRNLVTTDDVSPEQFSKEQDIKDIHLTSQQC